MYPLAPVMFFTVLAMLAPYAAKPRNYGQGPKLRPQQLPRKSVKNVENAT